MLKFNLKAVFAIFLLSLFSCESLKSDNGGMKTTENGLQYQIFLDEEGETAQIGQYMTFEMELVGKDTILSSTYQSGQPILTPVQEASFNGGIEEGLTLLSEGDSAVFKVAMDSLFKDRMNQIPPELMGLTHLTYRIKVLKIQSEEDLKAEQEAKAEEQKMADDRKIQEYLSENSINASRTESGIYYVITEEGNGENPSLQNQVTVHYTGKLLNGKVFDSSKPGVGPRPVSGDPATFPLSGVVKGWQEGIPLLEKGGSGTLYIPSHLGYGQQGAGADIPPNSILVFDVELIDFK